MKHFLYERGFHIFEERPEHVTLRARFPKSTGRHDGCDFVLCRKDGPSSDGRHPDFVEVGVLADDLARRDFSVNALAREINLATFEPTGNIVDLFEGRSDLALKRLRFVGEP